MRAQANRSVKISLINLSSQFRSVFKALLASFGFSMGVLAFCSQPTFASSDISIASMEIPMAYEKNGSGVYNRVFDELIKDYTGAVKTSFYPAARFDRLMATRGADCAFVATESLDLWVDHGIQPEEFEFIGPVHTLNVVVYIPIDADDITEVDQIKNLNLASDVNLVSTIRSLGIKENLALQSQIQMLNLLAVGRINGLIGYDFDLDLLSKQLGLRDRIKKASISLDKLTDGFLCFKTDKTKIFRQHLRQRLTQLKSSGWLKQAFDGY